MSKYLKITISFIIALLSSNVFADGNASAPNIATIANNILGSGGSNASDLVILMMAASATFGSAFALLAVLKFKQHKDNPQQTHLGQPFALFLIAVIFIWLPYYLGEAGYTLTGRSNANDRIELSDIGQPSLLCPDGGGDDSLGCPSND